MIHKAEVTGMSRIRMRRELGEWVRPDKVRQHLARPKATPVRFTEPEGALAPMMPRYRSISRAESRVSHLTTPPGGDL